MRYLLLSRYILLAVLFGVQSICTVAQIDNVGSGRAVQFDGIDDYIDFGSVYHDLNLPLAISAWVYLDPSSGASPIFTTNDNDQTYRGVWFTVSPNLLSCEFGDGTGGNNPAFRRGKQAILPSSVAGRWVNVCAVVTAPFDIRLFVNGIDVGGNSSGGSFLPMASSFPGDVVKSGYLEANGGVTYYYKGMIDEIRLWNRSLTQTEVQQNMCKKLTGSETGLIGYWNFDETSGTTITDKSVRSYNGQLKNNPTRVFSGAPLGDDSKYQYAASWTGSTVNFQDGNDLVSVSNIVGNPEGVHIYEVKNTPSQASGLDATASSPPYFGVFAASLDNNNSFSATYSYQGSSSCKVFSRANNSMSGWVNSTNPFTNVLQQTELLRSNGSGQQIIFDLGPDRIVCNQPNTTILTGVADPLTTFLWSTGETTSSISVSNPGKYLVNVTGSCGTRKDSIQIFFMKTPSFSLGNDSAFCQFNSIKLNPVTNPSAYIFKWQDGSTGSAFTATNFGKYWVTVSNQCGSTTDSISYTKATSIPFDLGPDKLICDQSTALLSTGISNPKATFRWSNGQTSSSISVSQSGKYLVDVHGPCLTRDSINIRFLKSPPPVSLGADQLLCTFKPVTLSPLADPQGYTFSWQDNSTQPSFAASDFGTYSVTVKNECGSSSTSITFSKYQMPLNLVPNVITPNGDAENQFFKVDDHLKGNVSLLILSRWGEAVYYSPTYQNDWDGSDLSPGVYYVVISGLCIKDFKDWLTIIH